ncbi:hypothetical protein niasHT_006368 [Heterodera trifolii]|uniref:Peptidase C1A papain C-terminal domain-containing protein n=1 Tax=Heterodera trifolii TaxID=157864 RepID=A0ABD2M0U7_9BILA
MVGQYGFVYGLEAQMDYLTTHRLPIAARMYAPHSFKVFKGNEIYDPSQEECKAAEEDPDNSMHIISIVGYGEEKGKPFWLIVNSYGQEWGDHGEAKYVRGKNACGIEQYGYFIKSVEHF